MTGAIYLCGKPNHLGDNWGFPGETCNCRADSCLLCLQVLDIPEDLLEDHDLTVDYILTPNRVIKTNCTRPKPRGIIWSKVSLLCSLGSVKRNLYIRELHVLAFLCLAKIICSVCSYQWLMSGLLIKGKIQ